MVIYFSGTGNSRFVAERIAAATSDELFDSSDAISREKGDVFKTPGNYIFVAPVYAAAPPVVFMDYIKHSSFPEGSNAYFIMTCASDMSASPVYWRKLSEEKGILYQGTAKVRMPQNYIPYFKMGSSDRNSELIGDAIPVIDDIAESIRSGISLPDAEIKGWERILTPIILKPFYKYMVSAKSFEVSGDCIGCGKCSGVCPLNNIFMKDRIPVWGDHCTHCMACINLCPAEAVEYGRLTKGKIRYHGPGYYYSEQHQTGV